MLPVFLLLAAATPPIVAVFDIHDTTGLLPKEQLEPLTSYFTAHLAEGGVFSIVPREQVKAALTAQKSESYRACYSEACQIEIGRELAAQKSLLTEVLRVGNACMVTSTLFDLRTGVSEKASTNRSPCSREDLVGSIEKVSAVMSGAGAGPTVPEITVQETREAANRDHGEWIGTGLTVLADRNSRSYAGYGVLLTARLFSLRFGWFQWTLIEAGIGGMLNDSGPQFGFTSFAGTRPGVVWFAGDESQHEFQFGLTLGVRDFAKGSAGETADVAFFVVPTARYLYHFGGSFSIGLGARAGLSTEGAIYALEFPLGWAW